VSIRVKIIWQSYNNQYV